MTNNHQIGISLTLQPAGNRSLKSYYSTPCLKLASALESQSKPRSDAEQLLTILVVYPDNHWPSQLLKRLPPPANLLSPLQQP
ncbi:conserved hypothetical protein [Ricinus communis]|uniref:Uncharacterized protein n=1 Tax=Ricinus communis TaxID=3988 RepID=B9RJB6_RICCO|nr:conserved hypothetical protein [Ricinus communis]